MIRALCWVAIASASCVLRAEASPLLDLTGATPTLDLDALHPVTIASSEQAWWPTPQQAKPLNASTFALTPGLPPDGAWPAKNGVTGAYWSGWSNEAEAYPNLGELQSLAGAGIAVPMSANAGTISLTAMALPSSAALTLPPQLAGREVLSGAFNSYPYGQEYGYFEITAQVPHGDGLWPAFWLIPVAMTKTAEIDVTEILGYDTTVSYSTIHTNDQSWTAQNSAPSFAFKADQDLSEGYHRYGVDWEEYTITFYMDGVAIKTFPTPADMHQPFYIVTNLAVGVANTWAGAANSTTPFPSVYSISSVRVWQRPTHAF